MNLVLLRTAFKPDGIYGEIESEDGKKLFFTLEHAYKTASVEVTGEDEWEAKIPKGTFRCVRGNHQLHNGIPFDTFMVTGIPNHDGILFHVGNYDRDSEGCILIGKQPIPDGIGKSGEAFREFMELQRGRTEFFLEVK